jgi:RHS repeat-associated protein
LPLVLNDGTRKYVYGLGLAYTVDITGTLQVAHTDGLGSVRAITDSAGTVVETYQSDAFGVPLLTQGTSCQPFQFTGQQQDPESGLYYLRGRYYLPSLGRFISRDPLFGSMGGPLSLNRFSYVLNNPTNLTDPSGLSSTTPNDPTLGSTSGVSLALQDSYGSKLLGGVGNSNNGSTDNSCFSSAGGHFQGNIVNAMCFDTPMGSEIVWAIVDTPAGPQVVATVVFAKPGKGAGGGKGKSVTDRMRDAGLTAQQAISAFKQGRIRGVFPGQFLQSTIDEIENAARSGDKYARAALKLLNRLDYDK